MAQSRGTVNVVHFGTILLHLELSLLCPSIQCSSLRALQLMWLITLGDGLSFRVLKIVLHLHTVYVFLHQIIECSAQGISMEEFWVLVGTTSVSLQVQFRPTLFKMSPPFYMLKFKGTDVSLISNTCHVQDSYLSGINLTRSHGNLTLF